MSERKRLTCPGCGAEMNFHAEKVDSARTVEERYGDPAFEGVLVEFHTCPACGYVEERTAS
jgi:C4-type Zn-finger protein